MRKLNDRINRDLARFVDGPSPDELEGVLSEYGTPEDAAAILSRNGQSSLSKAFLDWDNRIWLGVCAGLAGQFDVNPLFVRGLVVLLCFIPPLIPLLLIGYLGTFFYFYFTAARESIGPINPVGPAMAVVLAVSVAIVLHLSSWLVIWVIAKSYVMLSGQPFSVDPRWNWIVQDSGGLLFWALAICVPLGILSGMPLSKGWPGTLKKVYQAGLALYGVALCYGIAGVFVSLSIRFVQGATAGGEAESLLSILDEISAMAR
ncbi:MAG: hypothetical protein AMXMBFR84_34040 [Candidatus Hydrogenedentota bacterium]